ncbi:zinc finger protein 37 homolog isoform X2 [Nymphalis io]|uniref:zinc finger protein 37 homolog isoform X2 n=1 Tax=Inachis io TaxID=171585 RepID=UPI00216905F4|nr:zinc finger protein 37 homolog isoform X2 [Nymphalis io]
MNIIKGKGPIYDPGICRCCGAVKKCRLLNTEYVGLGRKEVYADMFVDCFGLVLSHLDGEPEERLICATCVIRLREASCFRQQVLECEEKLLRSKIVVHEGNKSIEVIADDQNNEQDDFKQPNEQIEVSDINIIVTEPLQTSSYEQPETPSEYPKCEDKPKLKRSLRSKAMAPMEVLKKRSRMTTRRMTAKNRHENTKIKDKEPIVKESLEKDKSILNIITIIENSYAYPFNSFFNNYYCSYCRQKFLDCRKLRDHSLTHDPATYMEILVNNTRLDNKICQIDFYRIDCRLCNENIDTIDTLKYHIINVHGKTMYPVKEDFLKFRLTPTNLKCTECDRTFSFFHTLKKHMAEHFGDCICDVCGAHYFEERMLRAHMKSHQGSNAIFSCKQCGKSFKSKYNLCIHIARSHTKEARYLCTKCDETFFSDTLRQKHMIDVHGEESIFKCDHCDKVYVSKKALRDHNRRIHLKLLKHQCNLCEKRFYLPCILKEHMSSHTGERNFRCEHCGKSYLRLRALKVHMQSHTSEKKYKCNMCNASYSQNVCLKNHIKRQHQHLESEESFQE